MRGRIKLFIVLGVVIWTVAVSFGTAKFILSGVTAIRAEQEDNSVHWLLGQIDEKNAQAQYYLGMAYMHGLKIPQNPTEALKWLGKSAAQNYGPAEYDIGYIYQHALAGPQSYIQAAKWYQKAAEHGVPAAEIELGIFYRDRTGVPQQDFEKAFSLFTKQAERGVPVAEANLGLAYHNGEGVTKDDVAAYKWLYLAASATDALASDKAKTTLAVVEKSLSPDQIAQAKRLIEQWKPVQ